MRISCILYTCILNSVHMCEYSKQMIKETTTQCSDIGRHTVSTYMQYIQYIRTYVRPVARGGFVGFGRTPPYESPNNKNKS